MSALTNATMAAVGVALVIALWFWMDHDPQAVIDFLRGNWTPVLLGVQVVAAFILTATNRYIAGGVLTCTSLMTLVGMVMA